MAKSAAEWIKQADYDYDTAELMHHAGRNFYAVFMCHMAIEKALKALLLLRTGEVPPKTHNLILLLSRIGLKPPAPIAENIIRLNEANVSTRYPEELSEMIALYDSDSAKRIISQAKETLSWIKTMQ
jgi:HEPN domain-containing protein